MPRTATKLIFAAALLATAACTKKAPEQLPPPPAGSDTGLGTPDAGAGTGTTQPGSAAAPGSRADFLQQVGGDSVYFGTDMYDIDAQAAAVLDRQAAWLTRYPNVRVTIEGHCDERGTREYNLALGDRRANAAKNYLASKGVSASRISTISYGKERPAATGSDENSWAQNRRAATIVIG